MNINTTNSQNGNNNEQNFNNINPIDTNTKNNISSNLINTEEIKIKKELIEKNEIENEKIYYSNPILMVQSANSSSTLFSSLITISNIGNPIKQANLHISYSSKPIKSYKSQKIIKNNTENDNEVKNILNEIIDKVIFNIANELSQNYPIPHSLKLSEMIEKDSDLLKFKRGDKRKRSDSKLSGSEFSSNDSDDDPV